MSNCVVDDAHQRRSLRLSSARCYQVRLHVDRVLIHSLPVISGGTLTTSISAEFDRMCYLTQLLLALSFGIAVMLREQSNGDTSLSPHLSH